MLLLLPPSLIRISFSTALLLVLGTLACKKKKVEPVSDHLQKVWTAQTVMENKAIVYSRGATGNIRNYSDFRLDLSHPPTASITDWDGLTFTGQYELSGASRLILKNLDPQPSGTNGTIEFSINSILANQLDLNRITASPKTGGTSNQYILTNP